MGLPGTQKTPEFKDKYRWRAGIESTMSEMDKTMGIKHLRVRGLSAVGYCARLKAVGVNLFRAARVKRALDALRTVPGTALSGIGTIIWVVKERFLNPGCRFRNIFGQVTENDPYAFSIAA